MTRLILAILVAVLLWPTDHINTVSTASTNTEPVPVRELLTVAHSVYGDISSFCTRNEDACATGRQIVQSAVGSFENFTESKTNDLELSETADPS